MPVERTVALNNILMRVTTVRGNRTLRKISKTKIRFRIIPYSFRGKILSDRFLPGQLPEVFDFSPPGKDKSFR